MAVVIGSARHDENGKLSGGNPGDQTGQEVATQNFYVHSKGWYILRAKESDIAEKLATAMRTACSNNNIGYDQSNRLGVIKYGINSKTKTEADCSSLVRACCIYAGFDPGNFTTSNEPYYLSKTGKFMDKIAYKTGTTIYTGDILVTKTSGHTVICTGGAYRTVPKPEAPASNNRNIIIRDGQIHARNFSGSQITADGVRGPMTRKAAARVLQTALNRDYNAGLIVDGEFGDKSKRALGKHYVELGETQYMVTAAEILLMLLGKDPNGVECPGTFGKGLKAAAGTSKITADKFLTWLN